MSTRTLKINVDSLDSVGASHYLYCLETARDAIKHARALMKGDVVEKNHELPLIERLINEAIAAS